MEVILTILIALYLIVVFFIMIQKRIDGIQKRQKESNYEGSLPIDYEQSRKWADYSANLKSSPFIEGYDRPDM